MLRVAGVYPVAHWLPGPIPQSGRAAPSDRQFKEYGRRSGPGNEDDMARYIFVVSAEHPGLYDYLLQRFADDPNAQVVLDRRRVERRRAEIPVTREHRQDDRRQRPDVSEELRRRSVAVVTISNGRGES